MGSCVGVSEGNGKGVSVGTITACVGVSVGGSVGGTGVSGRGETVGVGGRLRLRVTRFCTSVLSPTRVNRNVTNPFGTFDKLHA